MGLLQKSILLLLCFFSMMAIAQEHKKYFSWTQGTSIPDIDGFAGAYAGISNNVLIIAGGANFPNGLRPWSNGTKTWYSKIFALENPTASWKIVGTLPRPMGYGVSLTWRDGVICVGGGNADSNFTDAFILKYISGRIEIEKLPDLPSPLVNGAGVVLNDHVYVLAEQFWSIDLNSPSSKRSWKKLPALPGPSRVLCTMGTMDGNIYVFGGVQLIQNAGDTSASRKYLSDAWQFNTANGWKTVASMPHPLAAAPSPAYAAGQSHLLLFGGDDGSKSARVAELKDEHPGFSCDILAYNSITDSWSVMDQMPVKKNTDAAINPHGSIYAPVTTPLVVWNKQLVFAGGEARPAVRSNKVLIANPEQPQGRFGGLDWTVIGLYFLAVIGISWYVSSKMGNTTGDFFLGGQKIPWWAAGLSIFGSKLSALTFIAIPAKAYATDWVYIMNNIMIVAIAPIVTFFYLPYFRKLKLTSVYEYLQIRFNSNVKMLGSLTFVVFQLSRLGVVIYLPAMVLSTVTGINIFACILLTTLITTAYSVAGGIEAVVWTEVMQVFVLLGGALASFFFIINSSDGGFQGFIHEAYDNNKFRVANLGWSISQPVLWVVGIGALLTNLVTYTSDQVVVQRYLTTSTEKEARRSIYTNALMVIPASLIFFGVGTALWYFFRNHPSELNPNGRTDDVFPWFISQQLPAGLSGLVIAGLFAATMSTISSSMNSIATVVTTDFYRQFKKSATDQQALRFAKLFTILLGASGCLIAIYLVYLDNPSIWDQYLKIIGLFGGCLAGMFAAGIFFPKINSSGIMIGFLFSSIGLYFLQRSNEVSFFLYPLFAVLGCVIIGYLFSLVYPANKNHAIAIK